MDNRQDFNPYLGHKADVILNNTGLVHHIAKKFRGYINQSIDYDDLVSEGIIGLLKAFEYFDPSKVNGEIKFATYASRMIQGYIQTLISTKGSSVKTPRRFLRIISEINKRQLWETSAFEIAETINFKLKEVNEALHYLENRNVASLDYQINDEDVSTSFIDVVPTEDDSTTLLVNDFIDRLEVREQCLIKMLMTGEGQQEMSEQLGVSQSYVSRLVKRIGEKYKKYMGYKESEDIKMSNEVISRKVNQEEAKKYGIKTVTNGLEWFLDEKLPTNPTLGLNSNGLHLNSLAVKSLKCEVGQFVKIGFNAEQLRLVVVKDEAGLKLRKGFGNGGSIAVVNKRLVKWLDQKNIERKRYVLQRDETDDVYFIQLELKSASGQ